MWHHYQHSLTFCCIDVASLSAQPHLLLKGMKSATGAHMHTPVRAGDSHTHILPFSVPSLSLCLFLSPSPSLLLHSLPSFFSVTHLRHPRCQWEGAPPSRWLPHWTNSVSMQVLFLVHPVSLSKQRSLCILRCRDYWNKVLKMAETSDQCYENISDHDCDNI